MWEIHEIIYDISAIGKEIKQKYKRIGKMKFTNALNMKFFVYTNRER